MPKYAIYQTDVIVNAIKAKDQPTAQLVTGMNAIEIIDGVPQIGWTWSAETNSWIAPVPPEPEVIPEDNS